MMGAMQDDERDAGRDESRGATRSFAADVAVGVASDLASGSVRLLFGLGVAVVGGAAVFGLGSSTERWWPWMGLLVLAAGAFVARRWWPLGRYRVAMVVAVLGAGANLALGATSLPAVAVAVVAALIAIAALAWSLTEAVLTS